MSLEEKNNQKKKPVYILPPEPVKWDEIFDELPDEHGEDW